MLCARTRRGKIAAAGAVVAGLIGVAALLGWLFQIEKLKSPIQGTIAINPVTAFGLILCGSALVLTLFAQNQPEGQFHGRLLLLARATAIGVGVIGILRLVALLCGVDLGVDLWLFPSRVAAHLPFPSRMSPHVAFNFTILGIALFFVSSERHWVRVLVELCAALAGFDGLVAILGYAYGIPLFYHLGAFIPMALPCAISFLVLIIALLISHSDRGLLGIFAGESVAGTMARRLFPAAFLVPALLGWVVLELKNLAGYPRELEDAVFAVGNMLVFAFLVGRNAMVLFRIDQERKRAQEALLLLKSAVDQTQESILITESELESPGPKIVFVNPAFTQMTGYTAEEIIGSSPRVLQGPRTDRNMVRRVREHLERGEPFKGELINYRKDGGELHLDWQVAPIRDPEGTITHFVATHRDVSDRKKIESALRESNERFQQMAANISDVFWMRSPDMRELYYISPAFERIWGRPAQVLLERPESWVDFIFHEDRERVVSAFAQLAMEAPSIDLEYRICRPDGELRWVLVRGFQVRDEDGKVIRLTGIVSDMTERKLADLALRESEQRFRAYFELGLIGMVITSPDKGMLEVNERFCQMMGYSREELLSMSWPEFTHAEDLPKDVASFHRVLAGEQDSYGLEKRFIRKDGKIVHADISVQCVRKGNGQVDYILALVEDITERKLLQSQLFQAQKLETVGKLAGGVAHEFNSILTAIIGQSEMLLAELPTGSSLTGNATEISRAAGRAAALTRQLLAYGRKQILRLETLDLNRVIAGLEVMIRHLMGGAVEILVVPSPDLKAVKADAGQLEQVILNIAMNARDAMPRGGKLTVETANVSIDAESLGRYPELKPGDYVMVAITDTGSGMSEEVKAHIFEPFYSTKQVGSGTGLGLSTCYGIIKQSGGHISVYTELGSGSTFRIYLPQALEETSPTPARDPVSTALPGGTECIFLVEDDPALREIATSLLKRLGYKVFAAANGVEALALLQQSGHPPIDLLLTDLYMPKMNGDTLAAQVNALYPDTRILFSSAFTEASIAQHGGLRSGVEFLQKPFTPSALAWKLRKVLDQPSG